MTSSHHPPLRLLPWNRDQNDRVMECVLTLCPSNGGPGVCFYQPQHASFDSDSILVPAFPNLHEAHSGSSIHPFIDLPLSQSVTRTIIGERRAMLLLDPYAGILSNSDNPCG
jgi:hypothetical protein